MPARPLKPLSVRPSLSQLALKIRALRNEILRVIEGEAGMSIATERVVGYDARHAAIIDGLKVVLPVFFDELQPRACVLTSNEDWVYIASLHDMVSELDYCAEILGSINLEEGGVALRITREGAYFAGQQFDAIRQVQEIIATATKRISLIDNYAAETTLDLLAAKASAVAVRMMIAHSTHRDQLFRRIVISKSTPS